MKKLLVFFLLLFAFPSFGQSVEKGMFFADLSAGLGAYHGYNNLDYNPNKKVNAAASAFQFNGSYFLNERFSVGLELRFLSYLTPDDTNSIVKEAQAGGILINTDYVFANKKKFNAWVGIGIGANRFEYIRSEIDTAQMVVNSGTVKAGGALIDVHSGFRWCFSKHIGFNMRAGYSLFPMQVSNFTVNGEQREKMGYRNTEDVILNFRGLEIKAGLSFYF